ncbi:hypothetical protein MASR1M74_31670 [Lentimicrobium sp.]
MKIRLFLLLTLFSTLIFSACETDFDITADYKDITVVYGLLSQNDSVHYLKINKAFLGKGNALVFAKEPDSMSYHDDLEVIIEEIKNETVTHTIVFDTTTIANKNPGIFYYPEQQVFSAEYEIPSDYGSRTYRLQITNKKTGKVVTSHTPLIYDFSFSTPRPGQPVINFTSEYAQKIEWRSAKNGKRYDVTLRFWFDELIRGSSDTLFRYVDWALGTEKSGDINGGQQMELQYKPEGFFNMANSKIPYKPGSEISEDQVVARLVNRAEVIFDISGDDLNTYMEVNEPSSGIVQDKPEYTNIDNGIGLFSCRLSVNTRDSNRPGKVMTIGVPTEQRLMAGNLKFIKKPGN